MRGRTNVGGGGGISINAQVVDKIIQSGNIAAGDFVEYYKTNEYITQASNVDFKFSFGFYSIAIINNVITAFKNGQQVATYSDYNISTGIAKYNDEFILFCNSDRMGVLKIENDQFVLVDSIAFSSTFSAAYVGGANGKVICFGKTTSDITFAVADISLLGVLTNLEITTVSRTTDGNGGVGAICSYNGEFYIICPYSLSGYSDPASYLATISIGVDNSVSLGDFSYGNPIYGDRIVCTRINEIITSLTIERPANYDGTNTAKYYKGFLYICNFVTGSIIGKEIPNNGEIFSYIDDSFFIASGKTQFLYHNKYEKIANKLRLCTLNENTNEIVIVDEIVLPDDYEQSQTGTNLYDAFLQQVNRNVAGINSNNIYAQIKIVLQYIKGSSSSWSTIEDKNIYLYGIYNGELDVRVQEQYVLPYNAGHPIGVAKNAGTTGDTIGVYIPIPIT